MMDYLIYLPFVLIAFGIGMQLHARLSAWRMRGRMIATDPVFSVLDGLLPDWCERPHMLLYFSSEWCGPCKSMAPMIERLQQETGAILKLDALEYGELATHLGARGAPAFVLLEKGVVRKVHLGSLTEGALRSLLS